MTTPADTNLWLTIGSAVGGVITGIGSVLGINRVRERSGEGNVSEVDALKRELELTREEVSALKVATAQYQVFGDTLNHVHDALKRVHERMDGVEQKLARLEGFEQGRRSREVSRGER